jgi:xanthine dehydrogenase accessory factor
MSPGHHYDLEILAQVLPCRPSYVGCIGSRRKVAAVNAALAERGIPAADIARIHAPIGLPILAETPEEIAISIAAEMIRHRAQHSGE